LPSTLEGITTMNNFSHRYTQSQPAHLARTAAAATLLLRLLTGCSAGDLTETEAGTSAAEDTPSENAQGLNVSTSTHELLAGTLQRGDAAVAFEMEHQGDRYLTTIVGEKGELVLRATVADRREKLELGNGVTLDGPQGSLFRTTGPDLEQITISGDAARLTDGSLASANGLLRSLGAALAERSDVDSSVAPVLLGAPAERAAAAPDAEFGMAQQALAIDCGGCTLACQLDFGACLALAGPFGFVCVAPFISCMNGCAPVCR
jgi:hypothetical protein